MSEKLDNPLGTAGFEFVEFTGPDPGALCRGLEAFGFTHVATHRHKNVFLYRQGGINFVVNAEANSAAGRFARRHGQSANAMAFRVEDAASAIREAERRGAKIVENSVGPMELNIPAIEGVGGSLIYLVDRFGPTSIYDIDFEATGADSDDDAGLVTIDHLTHNLYRGNLDIWATFYERIFGFREIRRFDIEGKQTGLVSRAMTSPCGKIRIPLNESSDEKSQVEEFLTRYRGEGIQHIALATDDIYHTVTKLRKRGVAFQSTPASYFADVERRVGPHDEPMADLETQEILIDGSRDEGFLLQIFTQDAVGPIFFEIIQRKGNQGFGEGNFQALFESIERDQIARGVLDATV